ncbi:glycosyltransferase family 2 protein [Novosphingobium sp. P6W]|uniref:glycosyltransferase family 2 protein n=1 Tax=Novosphingobium sp. P6W TaxID=1609758 RepID=UPI0005C65B17|nr:glycosyltransferase family 2 protein [Novosphingobium sp. P6W]AXB80659.1 glycosyltransferase family 2 protein [Novosphingobium sp. P6W]
MSDNNIAVIILTYNEEKHLERAMRSVSSFSNEILVVDSFSTDRTVEIAKAFGARVLQRRFDNQARQFNWALDCSNLQSDWILRLDADEIIESDLAEEITKRLPFLSHEVVGINLKRKHIFLDRWIRHGGRYPLLMLRLWRRGHGRVEDRWMDEHVVVSDGYTVTLNGGFLDHNLNDLGYFTEKHNKYATREAIEILNQRYNLFTAQPSLTAKGSSFQATLKRFVKERIYNFVPFPISSLFYFLYRYVLQLGFLDGGPGIIYHFLQGFWYRFLVGAKVFEYNLVLRTYSSRHERIRALERLTGYSLGADI